MIGFFNKEENYYVRKDRNGNINGSVSYDNIPNPLEILEYRSRLKAKGHLPLDARVQADPITVKLWEHKCQI